VIGIPDILRAPGPSVGWVERSETHLFSVREKMGFAALNPSYALAARTQQRL